MVYANCIGVGNGKGNREFTEILILLRGQLKKGQIKGFCGDDALGWQGGSRLRRLWLFVGCNQKKGQRELGLVGQRHFKDYERGFEMI